MKQLKMYSSQRKVVICCFLAAMLTATCTPFTFGSPDTDEKYVILTFDDGHQYREDDESASIMQEFNYSGVAMLPVQVKDWQNMSYWIMLRNQGWEVGSHTWTHADLNKLSPQQLAYEVSDSKLWLENYFEESIVTFAYPFSRGSENETVLQALADAGYTYAREHMSHGDWNGTSSLYVNSYCMTQELYVERMQQLIGDAQKNGVAVAMFHGVSEELRGWGAILPSEFRFCLEQIRDSGIKVVTFKDLKTNSTQVILGDVDGDRDVDILDLTKIAGVYGSKEGDLEYDANCDLNYDKEIYIHDVVIAAGHFGETW